jgi:secreted trypsin-like serine protease
MLNLMRLRLTGLLLLAAITPGLAQTNSGSPKGSYRSAPFEEDFRIFGGEVVTNAKAWPWQIALYRKNTSGKLAFLCGGSLVAERWVLTAAHCIGSGAGRPGDFAVVERTMQIDLELDGNAGHGGRRLAVKQVIVHDGYDLAKKENDIALLELTAPAQSTPVPYARAATSALEETGRDAVVTGWGMLREIGLDAQGQRVDAQTGQLITQANASEFLDDKLRQVELPLIGWEKCREVYQNTGTAVIDARTLCAGVAQGGKDSCQGDSGGPLVARDEKNFFVQIGVVSWGVGCGRAGYPGVYTRVSAFEAWLREKTGIRQDQPSAESQQAVDNALAMDNPAGLAVNFVQGTRVKIGQEAQFRVATKKSGYLLLLDVQPGGSLTQIYPTAASLRTPTGIRPDANRVDPGRTLVVPNRTNPYEGFTFEVEGPAGEGRLVAVLSDRPTKSLNIPDMPRSFDSRADTLGFLAALGRAISRGFVPMGEERPTAGPGADRPPETAAADRPTAGAGADRPTVSVVVTPYTIVQ